MSLMKAILSAGDHPESEICVEYQQSALSKGTIVRVKETSLLRDVRQRYLRSVWILGRQEVALEISPSLRPSECV